MTIGATVTVEALESDPYPVYQQLRAEEPVSWVESVGLWLVTRWADVVHVVTHPEDYTAETEPSTLNRTFGRNLLASEDPYHERIRSIIEPAFRPGKIRPYIDAVIAPTARELISGFRDRGEVDLLHEFCEPLSVRVLKEVLGLSELADDTLRGWFEHLAMGAANFEGDPEKQAIADAASAEVDQTLGTLLDSLEDRPDDSILSRMLHARWEGERLSRQEIQSNTKVMIVGGMQEPGDLIGIGAWALLSHPQQADEVRADPDGLVRRAVEEVLRWYSPVGTSTRQTTRAVELAGVKLDGGALVAAVVSSANRDERRWTEPDRFDIHRQEGAHLAFATGDHFCVGAWLARAEARTALRMLLTELPGLRLDPNRPAEFAGWEFRRPLHLFARWDT